MNRKQRPKTEKPARASIPVSGGETNEVERLDLASLATAPDFAAFRVIRAAEQTSGIWQEIDTLTLVTHLREQATNVNLGDLTRAEAMLMNQATALQSLFARLVERAMASEMATPFEANMRMALRAQSQCRTTLETLATIKNPPVVYARQANVTTGPQQINNGTSSQAREIGSERSKLSGDDNELLQDAGASCVASRADPPLEAMAAVDRTPVNRG